MVVELGGAYLETLVKIALRTKGFYYTGYGAITDLAILHKYISDDYDFVFFIELAYECELGVDTLLGWAEEVRQEEVQRREEVKTIGSENEPF